MRSWVVCFLCGQRVLCCIALQEILNPQDVQAVPAHIQNNDKWKKMLSASIFLTKKSVLRFVILVLCSQAAFSVLAIKGVLLPQMLELWSISKTQFGILWLAAGSRCSRRPACQLSSVAADRCGMAASPTALTAVVMNRRRVQFVCVIVALRKW